MVPSPPWLLALVVGIWLALCGLCEAQIGSSSHSNNWAVLVCTSRFWFNYRVRRFAFKSIPKLTFGFQHVANTLGIYRSVKRLGIPDSNIILMLADDVACNPRNMFVGTVYSNADRKLDLYGDDIEVDYRGKDVSVENFIRLLTDRTEPGTSSSKRLMTDERSNVFVYMTGHGGDEFLKFQDSEEISAYDLAHAFETMRTQKRYRELFFMIDTCQANTMLTRLYSPNVLATGSSAKGENSYSHHADQDIGVAVVDRFSHFVLSYLEDKNKSSTTTLHDFTDAYSFDICHSNPGLRRDLLERPLSDIAMTDFLGAVSPVSRSSLLGEPSLRQAPLEWSKRRRSGRRRAGHPSMSRRAGQWGSHLWKARTAGPHQ